MIPLPKKINSNPKKLNSNKKNQPHLEHLPPEILSHITSFLDATSLSRLSLSSRTLYRKTSYHRYILKPILSKILITHRSISLSRFSFRSSPLTNYDNHSTTLYRKHLALLTQKILPQWLSLHQSLLHPIFSTNFSAYLSLLQFATKSFSTWIVNDPSDCHLKLTSKSTLLKCLSTHKISHAFISHNPSTYPEFLLRSIALLIFTKQTILFPLQPTYWNDLKFTNPIFYFTLSFHQELWFHLLYISLSSPNPHIRQFWHLTIASLSPHQLQSIKSILSSSPINPAPNSNYLSYSSRNTSALNALISLTTKPTPPKSNSKLRLLQEKLLLISHFQQNHLPQN